LIRRTRIDLCGSVLAGDFYPGIEKEDYRASVEKQRPGRNSGARSSGDARHPPDEVTLTGSIASKQAARDDQPSDFFRTVAKLPPDHVAEPLLDGQRLADSSAACGSTVSAPARG
jgi:hypothetical protein